MESITSLLSALTTALDSAASVLPVETPIQPPADGISLFNVKNELLLSYLQHLVFLLLLKLRNRSNLASSDKSIDVPAEKSSLDQQDIVKRLVELRVYLEKGVRPLEGKLKYQVDKVVKAAEDADRSSQQKAVKTNGTSKANKGSSDEGSSGESSEDDEDSDASSQAGSEIDELSFRPNPAAFRRALVAENTNNASSNNDGIYRPPRIAPTLLPEARSREDRASRRPAKSATIDEFIAHELSAAPVAEPSIGSTIAAGGRYMKSRKDRQEEAERRDYEEANLVRLPKLSRKERAKNGSRRQDNFGGEEWRDLGAGLDRINKVTQKKAGVGGALERSRKRAIEDGPRGSGAEFGRAFEKKRRMHSRSRRG